MSTGCAHWEVQTDPEGALTVTEWRAGNGQITRVRVDHAVSGEGRCERHDRTEIEYDEFGQPSARVQQTRVCGAVEIEQREVRVANDQWIRVHAQDLDHDGEFELEWVEPLDRGPCSATEPCPATGVMAERDR